MNILLIDPPYERLMGRNSGQVYPLGLAYIASMLVDQGYNCIYLNLDYDHSLPSINRFSRTFNIDNYKKYTHSFDDMNHNLWQEIRLVIDDYQPEIVGITATTLKMPSVIQLANIIKESNREILVVVGGHHPQLFPEEILSKVNNIDIIVKGEGEETFLQLVQTKQKALTSSIFLSSQILSDIPGIMFRDEEGNVVETEDRPLMADLNCLPYPHDAYFVKHNKNISYEPIPINFLMGSRGCPFDCKYCATNNIWKRRIRYRNVDNIIDEIRYRINKQGDYYYYFFDDCFTLNKSWLEEFTSKLIVDKLRINWSCITSPTLVNEDIFKRIVKAGCKKINIAIESGSKRILDYCNKAIELEHVKKIFSLSKKYNISTTAYIMIGFPTETEEDIKKTQSIIKEVDPDWVYANVLIPLPGTGIFDIVVQNNMIDINKAWSGTYMKHLQQNFTGTIPDDKFNELVDETFNLCYRINTRISKIIKRFPTRQLLRNPGQLYNNFIRFLNYRKKK